MCYWKNNLRKIRRDTNLDDFQMLLNLKTHLQSTREIQAQKHAITNSGGKARAYHALCIPWTVATASLITRIFK